MYSTLREVSAKYLNIGFVNYPRIIQKIRLTDQLEHAVFSANQMQNQRQVA